MSTTVTRDQQDDYICIHEEDVDSELTEINTWRAVSHVNGETEAGFDLTGFESVHQFEHLLEAHRLPKEPVGVLLFERDQCCVLRDRAYVFANEEVMLIVDHLPDNPRYEPGYVGYIGIEGKAEPVESLFMDIEESAEYIKGRESDDRYI